MTKDEFTKLFNYMQEMRSEMNERFAEVDTRFDEVQSQFDGLTKLITDYHQEMMMLSHKVDRY